LRVDDDALAPGPESWDAAPPEPRAPDRGPQAHARAAIRRWLKPDYAVAAALGLLVLAVHDVGYMITQSFWTDESWVAVTTRFPLSQLLATTDSTPIGWSLLLRVVTVPATQVSRLLPLAFAGVAVVIAYWLARRLGWRRPESSVAAGLLAAIGVLLVPAMLGRNDLKQYTADACLSLAVLALTARLERAWSRRWLAALSLAVWGGMLFSDATAFVGTAAFAAMCVVELLRRRWRRLIEAAVAGAGTAVLMIGIYAVFDRRAVTPALVDAPGFSGNYLPFSAGLHADISFVTSRFASAGPWFGLGPAWLAVPLFVIGVITIVRLGRPATAITVAALWPELLAVSAFQKYPFLESRTSTFLFVITVVVAAIGLVGACSLVRRWFKGTLAAGLAVASVAAFTVGAWPYIRSHTIPNEDVRDQTRYVAEHDAPSDVIVVNLSSNWGFAYYWPVGQPSQRPDSVVAQGYEAYFPDQSRIVVARDRVPASIDVAVTRAVALARQRSSSRIWLIRSHMSTAELGAWAAAFARDGLSPTPLPYGLSVVRVVG
jgi:hypothetical protein